MCDVKRGIYIVIALLAAVVRGFAQDGASNIEFTENKGQWDPRGRFKGGLPTGALFLEKKGFSVFLYNADDLTAFTGAHHGMAASQKTTAGSVTAAGVKVGVVPTTVGKGGVPVAGRAAADM